MIIGTHTVKTTATETTKIVMLTGTSGIR